MAGLLDFGSNPYAGLLSEEDLAGARRQATTDALLKLSAGLFQAGAPSRTPQSLGAALVGGLQGVGAGYQGTLQQAAQQKLMQQKLQAELQSKQRAAKAQELMPNLFTQATPYQPAPYLAGAPYGKAVQAKPAGLDQDIQKQLMALGPEGQKAFMDALAMRKATQGETLTLAPDSTLVRVGFDGQPEVLATGAPKSNLTSDYKNYQSAQAQGFTGSFMDYQTAIKKAGVEDKSFSRAIDLRKDFRSEPVYKAQQEMTASYAQVKAGLDAKSPVGDLAAATKIMKLLDPGSVVRESELGLAMAATGLLDRVTNYAENVVKGTKLTDQQRKDFANLAQSLYSISESEYNKKREEYVGIAKRNQLPLEDVVGPAASLPKIQRIGWEE